MNVLVLATNRTLTLSLLRCLRPLRARVFVLAAGAYPVIQLSNCCHQFSQFDPAALTTDPASLVAQINDYCRRNSIAVVLPSGIPATLFLAEHGEGITSCAVFPLSPVAQIRILHNKWQFSQFLQAHSLPQPATRLLTSLGDATALDLPFPVIAKPLELDASQGVTKIDTRRDLERHVARQPAGGLPLLVQEYVDGPDVSLSVLARHGTLCACTIQKPEPRTGAIEFIRHEGVRALAEALAEASGLHGVANFDLRLDRTEQNAYIVECNPRFWASVHVAMCCGVNFPDLGIRIALGETLPPMRESVGLFRPPERALRGIFRGGLSAPTWRGMRLELADPAATATRLLEKRMPAVAAALATALSR